MSVTQIARDLYQIELGGVNAFLIDENDKGLMRREVFVAAA